MTTARDLAARLGLHRAGRDWRGTCPSCGYRDTLILAIGRTGAPVAWCASCQDRDAMRALVRGHGAIAAAPIVADDTTRREREGRARERAVAIWRGAVPAAGTPGDVYLIGRGLTGLAASLALRYPADTPHPDRGRYPALIALVSNATGAPLAIHRTYLRRDGTGKANLEPQRATLGPMWGGAVRLDAIAPELVIGEGLETSASAGRLIGLPAWAAISASNLARGVVLPREVRCVVIAADADDAGRDAARAAWFRWRAEERNVRVLIPGACGSDCNDILRARLAAGVA
jgi:hypothetical protein